MPLHRNEFRRLLHGPPQEHDHVNDQAADEVGKEGAARRIVIAKAQI
jgi:hypothetical protein